MDTTIKNNHSPIISVILPVYNTDSYVKQALESVYNQSYTNYELIIIDDGSTDTSAAIIGKWVLQNSDPRIRLISHSLNTGLIETLNEGLREARGEYIARIDADDIWTNRDKLKIQLEFLEKNTDHALVGTWAKTIDSSGKDIGEITPPTTDKKIRNQILMRNCFIHPSVLFRKSIAKMVGNFVPNEKYVEDYSLWLRIGKQTKFANIPEYLISYRIHSESITKTNNKKQIINCLDLIKQYRNDYPNFWIAYIKWKIQNI